MIGRVGMWVLVLGLFVGSFFWVEKVFRNDRGPIDISGPGAPVKQIEFSSIGVLSQKWFMSWFGPVRGRSLMDLDIEKIRMELEKESQVVAARVTRKFPATLEISLEEQLFSEAMEAKEANSIASSLVECCCCSSLIGE